MSHKFNHENVLNLLEEKINIHSADLECYKFIKQHIISLQDKLELIEKEPNIFIKDNLDFCKNSNIIPCCQLGHPLIFKNNKISCLAGNLCYLHGKEGS